jgi:hypothetical protein
MNDERKIVVRTHDAGGIAGIVWLIGWLFTWGYCHLVLPKAAFAALIWPYFLGVALKG